MIIRTDILIMPVFHTETTRDCAKLYKAEAFIQMARMCVGCHDRIKLKHTKSMQFSLFQTILYQFFTDMQASCIPVDRIAGITDVSAAPNVVWVQDIKS